jgi:hypothetical protein
LVFKRILTIFILSFIPPVAGPLISPRRRHFPCEPEANIALSQNPLFHYFSIPIGAKPLSTNINIVLMKDIIKGLL